MSFNPPPLPPFQPEWYQFQNWWQMVIDDLKSSLTDITSMFDDDILTPSEKPQWIFWHQFLTNEQSALEAEATTYGITTEKTNYTNAISALTTYLNTLTSPVAWNVLTDNTTITGTTLRSKFNDVLVTKQALLNKMHDSAKVLADDAAADATAAAREEARINSYPDPTNVLSGHDDGGTARIDVAAHTRVYPVQGDIDVPDVVIPALASISSLAFNTKYWVYYDDTTLADTTPNYQATTDVAVAQVGYAAGRHFVGVVTTPADGGTSTSGDGPLPPGDTGDGTALP